MKHTALFMLFAGLLQVVPAAAQPCVGAGYDKPLPGASDVVMRYADVPSSRFPGIWQEGLIGGNFYQIFSNRVAVLRANRLSQDWSITLQCQERPCRTTMTGTPPDATKATLAQLEQCLVPPEVKVAAAPAKPKPKPNKAKPKPQEPKKSAVAAPVEAKPKDQVKTGDPAPAKVAGAATQNVVPGTNSAKATAGAKANPEAQAKPTAAGTRQQTGAGTGKATGQNAAPATEVVCLPVSRENAALRPLNCGLSLVPPGTPEFTLQRLLVLAGADPGPVDGAIGPKTNDAVLVVLGLAARNMDLQQSIAAVDAYLCRQGQPLP